MAGTTIKGVGNDGNVQIRDMVTAAKQNAGTGFQAVWNKTQNNAQTTGNGGCTTDGRNDVRRGQSLRTGDRQRDHLAGTQEKSDGAVSQAKQKRTLILIESTCVCSIGVARLELAASCSQSRRATNCATPRHLAARLHRQNIVYRFLRGSSIQNPQLGASVLFDFFSQ